MKKKTYQTEHPTIKEITIGDKFIRNDGEIVTFVKYNENNNIGENVYPFIMVDIYDWKYTFSKELKFDSLVENHTFDINQRYITLKDKLVLL